MLLLLIKYTPLLYNVETLFLHLMTLLKIYIQTHSDSKKTIF